MLALSKHICLLLLFFPLDLKDAYFHISLLSKANGAFLRFAFTGRCSLRRPAPRRSVALQALGRANLLKVCRFSISTIERFWAAAEEATSRQSSVTTRHQGGDRAHLPVGLLNYCSINEEGSSWLRDEVLVGQRYLSRIRARRRMTALSPSWCTYWSWWPLPHPPPASTIWSGLRAIIQN